MTARFIPSAYPGGRILLRSGQVDVGAIFPPRQGKGRWPWRLWVTANAASEGEARTEDAARAALLARWREFLADADLHEATRR